MKKKRTIQETKQKILEALEEETSFSKSIKSLVPAFYSLALMSIGIRIMEKSLK